MNITVLNGIGPMVGITKPFANPAWLPNISFTWFAMIGAVVVIAVGIWFRTPEETIERAKKQMEHADSEDSTPMSLREEIA